MTSATSRALLFISWSIPACAAVAVAIQALSAWLAPAYLYLNFGAALFVAGVLPWLLITYVAASKRFGIGWHWVPAAIVSTLAVEASRISLSGVLDVRVLTKIVGSSCLVQSEATISQLQYMAFTCAIAGWSVLTTAAFVRAVTAALLLAAGVWLYTKLFSGRSEQ